MQQPYILWIASWYPNRYEPFNGDFIQRHAQATSLFTPVVLFHFVAPGPRTEVEADEEHLTETHSLKEHVYYIRFKSLGIALADKIRYHFHFYNHAKKRLSSYFKQHGLPAGVHVHVPMKGGNLALWIKKEWGIPFTVSEHSSAYVPQVQDHFFTRTLLFQRQVRRIFSQAKAVTTVSRYIGKVLENLFAIRVQTIHNVVDTDRFFFSAQPPQDPFTFIHVSTLDWVKNIDGILSVFAQLKNIRADWRLVLVGPASAALHHQVTEHGLLPHVHFTGMIPYNEVAVQMQSAHALVLFSRLENFPCVIIEALCCGLPVVTSAVAGVPEAINETNGILVTPNDEKDLLQALEKMITDYNRFDQKSIADKAQEKYSYHTIGAQIFNLYRHHFAIGQ